MSISLDQIKELRDITGVSITACKKALTEADGDMDKAIELLRKKGEAKAADRADRDTSEGVVAVADNGSKAVMIKLASETDFVAKNDDFVKAANEFAETLLEKGEDTDLSGDVTDLSLKMGEKLQLETPVVVEGDVIGTYVHSNNKIAAVVALKGGNEEVAKNVAMHASAMKPATLSPSDVSDELVAKEKEIWTDELKQSGKPENIWDNIMAGKEKKFREAAALESQDFVMDSSKTVGEYVKENGGEITDFKFMQ